MTKERESEREREYSLIDESQRERERESMCVGGREEGTASVHGAS